MEVCCCGGIGVRGSWNERANGLIDRLGEFAVWAKKSDNLLRLNSGTWCYWTKMLGVGVGQDEERMFCLPRDTGCFRYGLTSWAIIIKIMDKKFWAIGYQVIVVLWAGLNVAGVQGGIAGTIADLSLNRNILKFYCNYHHTKVLRYVFLCPQILSLELRSFHRFLRQATMPSTKFHTQSSMKLSRTTTKMLLPMSWNIIFFKGRGLLQN